MSDALPEQGTEEYRAMMIMARLAERVARAREERKRCNALSVTGEERAGATSVACGTGAASVSGGSCAAPSAAARER